MFFCWRFKFEWVLLQGFLSICIDLVLIDYTINLIQSIYFIRFTETIGKMKEKKKLNKSINK